MGTEVIQYNCFNGLMGCGLHGYRGHPVELFLVLLFLYIIVERWRTTRLLQIPTLSC